MAAEASAVIHYKAVDRLGFADTPDGAAKRTAQPCRFGTGPSSGQRAGSHPTHCRPLTRKDP